MRRLARGLPSRSGVEVPLTSIDALACCVSDGNLGVIGGLKLDIEAAADTSTGVDTFDLPGKRILYGILDTQHSSKDN